MAYIYQKLAGKGCDQMNWLLEKISKINKPLVRLIQKKKRKTEREGERTQMNKIRIGNKTGKKTTESKKMQSIREYYEKSYATNWTT